jgi:hypothetical protein
MQGWTAGEISTSNSDEIKQVFVSVLLPVIGMVKRRCLFNANGKCWTSFVSTTYRAKPLGLL